LSLWYDRVSVGYLTPYALGCIGSVKINKTEIRIDEDAKPRDLQNLAKLDSHLLSCAGIKNILARVGLGLGFNVTEQELKKGNKGAAGDGWIALRGWPGGR